MPSGSNPRHNGNSRRIFDYYRNSPGVPIHYKDVAEALNLEPQRTNSAIGHLVRHSDMGIRRVGQAGYYQYQPNNKGLEEPEVEVVPETFIPEIYELVGKGKNGTILVKDENGDLYTLTEWVG